MNQEVNDDALDEPAIRRGPADLPRAPGVGPGCGHARRKCLPYDIFLVTAGNICPARRRPGRRCSVATVDARPIIAAGGEPFDTIMAAVTALADGEELVVLAPFEPVPLEGVLGSQGFSYDAA
ncbi:MAG TPA: hypothetical protein DHU96_02935, partial [Actinobacteria bacterium]|nr:hypothetical protein [Actinomycetota bacterium]